MFGRSVVPPVPITGSSGAGLARLGGLAPLACAALLVCVTASGCASLRRPAALPPNAIRPVVAVASFENRSGFPGRWQLGTGMAELLLEEIVRSDRFRAVERLQLDAVLQELARQEHSYFRSEGKATPELYGARYLIRGTVTDFSQTAGGSLWLRFRRLFTGGEASVARVALTLSIVDVSSGAVVGSVSAAGTATARRVYAEGDYAGVSFGGDAFFRTPLGAATRAAISDALARLVDRVPLELWRPLIAEANGERIVVNGGLDRGLRTGQEFRVRARARRVTDPITGDPLGELPGAVLGRVRLVEVQERIAIALPLDGEDFHRGQTLEPIEDRPR